MLGGGNTEKFFILFIFKDASGKNCLSCSKEIAQLVSWLAAQTGIWGNITLLAQELWTGTVRGWPDRSPTSVDISVTQHKDVMMSKTLFTHILLIFLVNSFFFNFLTLKTKILEFKGASHERWDFPASFSCLCKPVDDFFNLFNAAGLWEGSLRWTQVWFSATSRMWCFTWLPHLVPLCLRKRSKVPTWMTSWYIKYNKAPPQTSWVCQCRQHKPRTSFQDAEAPRSHSGNSFWRLASYYANHENHLPSNASIVLKLSSKEISVDNLQTSSPVLLQASWLIYRERRTRSQWTTDTQVDLHGVTLTEVLKKMSYWLAGE